MARPRAWGALRRALSEGESFAGIAVVGEEKGRFVEKFGASLGFFGEIRERECVKDGGEWMSIWWEFQSGW